MTINVGMPGRFDAFSDNELELLDMAVGAVAEELMLMARDAKPAAWRKDLADRFAVAGGLHAEIRKERGEQALTAAQVAEVAQHMRLGTMNKLVA